MRRVSRIAVCYEYSILSVVVVIIISINLYIFVHICTYFEQLV